MIQQLTKHQKIDLSTTDISKLIRKQLKKEFPGCKFSVTSEYYSMGSSISVRLMESNIKVIRDIDQISDTAILLLGESYNREDIDKRQQNKHQQLNEFCLKDEFEVNKWNNGVFLTEEGFKLLKRVVEIVNYYNYDESDSRTDYYDVNFAFNLSLGKWDKPMQENF